MFFLQLLLNKLFSNENTSHLESGGRKMFFLKLSLNNFSLAKKYSKTYSSRKNVADCMWADFAVSNCANFSFKQKFFQGQYFVILRKRIEKNWFTFRCSILFSQLFLKFLGKNKNFRYRIAKFSSQFYLLQLLDLHSDGGCEGTVSRLSWEFLG